MFFSLIQTFINIDVGVLKRLCVLRLIYRSLWLEFLMFPSMDKQTGTDAGNTQHCTSTAIHLVLCVSLCIPKTFRVINRLLSIPSVCTIIILTSSFHSVTIGAVS